MLFARVTILFTLMYCGHHSMSVEYFYY